MGLDFLKLRLVTVGVLGAAVVLVWCCSTSMAQGTPTETKLTNDHCIVCHPKEPALVAVNGGKHSTAVGCLDCHKEHPPQGAQAVPQCGTCHMGKEHYALENCSQCHASGHAPLNLRLEGEITEPCLTCHSEQGLEVKHYPSAHAQMACNDCHASHREVPACLDCHSKHTEEMDQASCTTCHPAHKPLVVKYERGTPSEYCKSCHEKAFDVLAVNTTKHHDMTCDNCHRSEHKAVPPCFACHGRPHPEAMLAKFGDCSDCHGTAHDLRR
ncbi:MAG: cytochrome C [Proteobacteria bacterium]|nr:cytochrome C [Pseudomonadota bacterium]